MKSNYTIQYSTKYYCADLLSQLTFLYRSFRVVCVWLPIDFFVGVGGSFEATIKKAETSAQVTGDCMEEYVIKTR